jgi:hypothetical protein
LFTVTGVGHRLDDDRVGGTDLHAADVGGDGLSAGLEWEHVGAELGG